MVFVAGVGLDAGEDLVFGYEAGDVVDVAVGVVAGAALVEPEDLFDAEVVVEGPFEVLAGFGFGAEAGVALLDFGEEALFGGEEEAGAVGVDAAAFEDEAVGFAGWEFDLGFELGDVVVFGDVLGDLIVAAPVVVLGPGVELPVGDGEVAGGVFDEDGAGVAEPDAVGGPGVEVEAGEVGSGAEEVAGGAALGVGVVDEDVDVFDLGEMADDLGSRPRGWAGIFRASLRRCGARRSRWRRGEPTRRACGSRSACGRCSVGTPYPYKSVQSLPIKRFKSGLSCARRSL